MKIELLYFDSCPNHETALANLREALSEAGASYGIELIKIAGPEDVIKHRFLGSPSIRINGIDIEITEDASTEYSMRCRRYKNDNIMEGYPSKKLITKKLATIQED